MNKYIKKSRHHINTKTNHSYLANEDVYMIHATEIKKDSSEPVKRHASQNVSHSGPGTVTKDPKITIRKHAFHSTLSKPLANDIPLSPLKLSFHPARPDIPVAKNSMNSNPESILSPAKPSFLLSPVIKDNKSQSRKHVMSNSPYYTTTSDEMDKNEAIPGIQLSEDPKFVADQLYNLRLEVETKRKKPTKKTKKALVYNSEEEYYIPVDRHASFHNK